MSALHLNLRLLLETFLAPKRHWQATLKMATETDTDLDAKRPLFLLYFNYRWNNWKNKILNTSEEQNSLK
jgi:hypothetical protein